MTSSSPAAYRPLDLVPPELVLQIISHLDLADIANISLASKSCHNLITESEQTIYRAAGFRLGLTNPQSAGATAAVVAPPAPTEARHQRDEVRSIIKQQQSISTHYEGVDSWKDFGKPGSIEAALGRVAHSRWRPSQSEARTPCGLPGAREGRSTTRSGWSKAPGSATMVCTGSSWKLKANISSLPQRKEGESTHRHSPPGPDRAD